MRATDTATIAQLLVLVVVLLLLLVVLLVLLVPLLAACGSHRHASAVMTRATRAFQQSHSPVCWLSSGPEEKEIFNEILRVLKPGGLFLWGNALPTRVWLTAEKELTGLGFDRLASLNHTAAAVVARDEDEDRVNSYAAHLYSQYPAAFQMPVRGEMCRKVVDRLLLNFYRHPGTALCEYNLALPTTT